MMATKIKDIRISQTKLQTPYKRLSRRVSRSTCTGAVKCPLDKVYTPTARVVIKK